MTPLHPPETTFDDNPKMTPLHPPESANPETTMPPYSQWSGFKIVGDNLDKTIKPQFMHSDNQSKSVHYFHAIAIKDHVHLTHLSDDPPSQSSPCPKEISKTLFPTHSDDSELHQNFAIHSK